MTRTIGPLHFEDLEPKRFEDLVRQLAYDFKPWRRLEATGRGGSDDGFDARGFEIVQDTPTDDADENDAVAFENDRLWLIQCKRERTISPAKLSSYLDGIHATAGERLYGIVFVAACDFSKRARDLFRCHCEAQGIEEWHLWGKAELEDLLFQPRNDGLLFAYFGVSLTIRRRTQKADLRAKLVMKRKAHRILEKMEHNYVLLRSPDAHQYPYSYDVPNFKKRPLWLVRQFDGMDYNGLLFCIRRHFAYLDNETNQWDAAFAQNDATSPEDPWRDQSDDRKLRGEIYRAWSELPEQKQAWLEIIAVVPFEAILDIDELGDNYFEAPHIYVPFNGLGGPFADFRAEVHCRDGDGKLLPKNRDEGRVAIFKEEWRVDPTLPAPRDDKEL